VSRKEARHTRARRRRLAVAIGAVAVVCAVGLVVAGVALFSGNHGASVTSSVPPSSAAGTAPPATVPASTGAAAASTTAPGSAPLAIGRTYAVGVHEVTYVDTTRSTSANGDFPGASTRTLPTTIWYPAQGSPGGDPQSDAPPDQADGPYPLVLFAHGYDVTPDFYAPLLQRWAAAGYVVAAPTFPILSGSDGGASHVDYTKTFGDASFVIDRILATASTDPVAALVDPNRVAAAGHSDGEVIAYGLGFLQCCRDQRVKAVIPMAGNLANANNPSVANTGIPILHIMETNDEYDPYADSIAWDRDNLTSPRWMLSLLNASHVPPYTQAGNPYFELVATTTIDFLDGTLKGHPERLDQIAADVAAQPSLASLER
jgi:dienelactone hydrolase